MKRLSKVILGITFSIIITYFLLKNTSLNELIKSISEANIGIIFLGFLAYLTLYLARTIRFQKVSKIRSFKKTFSVVCIHNFLNNIIPFKVGELSYPLMLKRRFKIPFSKALADLTIMRFFDLMSLGLILVIAVLFSYQYFSNLLSYSLISLAILILIFFIVFFLSKFSNKTSRKNKILNFFLLALSNLSKRSKKDIIFLTISTPIISLLMFLTAFSIIRGLGLDAPFSIIVIGGTLSILATLIPIQGPLNIGTTEIGYIFPFIVYGIAKEKAIAISFSYHIFILIFTLILFLIGISLSKSQNKEAL